MKRKLKNPYKILGEEIYLAFLDGKNAYDWDELIDWINHEDRRLIKDAYIRGYQSKKAEEEYNASH